MTEKTKICCFDVDEDIKEHLSGEHEVFSGSLVQELEAQMLWRVLQYTIEGYR